MAVYKIFPEKDTTIYSEFPDLNTGLDSILEVKNTVPTLNRMYIGQGSDTILAQIAAETLGCTMEQMIVYSSDSDLTPFDTGAYASSTTYVSGNAVFKAATKPILSVQNVLLMNVFCAASIISLFPTTAVSAYPFPIVLPNIVISGSTLYF